MDRQRSFSIKATRFLVLAFTISSSLIFLLFFSFWLIKATPSVHQETHFQFRNPTLNLGLKPLTLQTLTASSRNLSASEVSNPILINTLVNVSRFEGLLTKKSGIEVSGDEKNENHVMNGNLVSAKFSVSVGSTSGFADGSIFKGFPRKENESKVSVDEIDIGDSVNGNLTIRQQNATNILSEKVEVSSGERIKEKSNRICDITKGRWVFDESYPLYTNDSCPFVDEGFNCEGNGRLDKEYMKWRWQPQDCDIPRFYLIFFSMIDISLLYIFGSIL
ncbi:hypothetical protein CsSME_00047458 [Camellia sinensis var. sinensis]